MLKRDLFVYKLNVFFKFLDPQSTIQMGSSTSTPIRRSVRWRSANTAPAPAPQTACNPAPDPQTASNTTPDPQTASNPAPAPQTACNLLQQQQPQSIVDFSYIRPSTWFNNN